MLGVSQVRLTTLYHVNQLVALLIGPFAALKQCGDSGSWVSIQLCGSAMELCDNGNLADDVLIELF